MTLPRVPKMEQRARKTQALEALTHLRPLLRARRNHKKIPSKSIFQRPASGATKDKRFDVINVGSGAGGGTLAKCLAPSGRNILILERGDWFKREAENWDAAAVFEHNRYVSPDTWCDRNGRPFQLHVHYFVGGTTLLRRFSPIPAAACVSGRPRCSLRFPPADRPESRSSLGSFLAKRGRAVDAETEYKVVLQLSPQYSPAAINLADLYRSLGARHGTSLFARFGTCAAEAVR